MHGSARDKPFVVQASNGLVQRVCRPDSSHARVPYIVSEASAVRCIGYMLDNGGHEADETGKQGRFLRDIGADDVLRRYIQYSNIHTGTDSGYLFHSGGSSGIHEEEG